MGRQDLEVLSNRARRDFRGSRIFMCLASRSSIRPVVGGLGRGGKTGTCPAQVSILGVYDVCILRFGLSVRFRPG